MKGEKKTPKTPGFMRVVVARNVSRLLDHHYSHLPNLTRRQRDLAKDSGVGFGTIQRIMKEEVGASLDNLESLADTLQVQMYQLMLPSLDVKNPQVVQGATEAEQRMYRQWKRTGSVPSETLDHATSGIKEYSMVRVIPDENSTRRTTGRKDKKGA